MSPRNLLLSLLPLAASLAGLVLSPDASAAPGCRQGAEVRVWTAPLSPEPGEPMEVLAVATDEDLDRILITDPAGSQSPLRGVRYGGPPWALHGGVFRPRSGTYRIEAVRGGQTVACGEVRVGGDRKSVV